LIAFALLDDAFFQAHDQLMAVKIIKPRDSKPTVGRFLARVRSIRVSEPALDAMERQVQARKMEPARAVKR